MKHQDILTDTYLR